MSHDVIGNIAFNQQMVHSMCSNGTIERVVDGTVPHIGAIHGATQMEVDGVTAQLEGLASIAYLSVLNS